MDELEPVTRRAFLMAGAGMVAMQRADDARRVTFGRPEPATQPGVPKGVFRLDYVSGPLPDWALLWPPDDRSTDTWVVMVHGHGSAGDQLYTRPDLRDVWLPAFRRQGLGVLTPNLRGNAWMSPEAVNDLHQLLAWTRRTYRARRFVLASGSMGGTSSVLYAACHPEDAAAVVALCPATDLATYYAWCRKRDEGVLKEIADAIQAAYHGDARRAGARYATCSALRHAARLTMPLYVAHGTADDVIPISQSRRLVGALAEARDLCYVEVAGGGHDSPLPLAPEGLEWVLKAANRKVLE